jgi:hypothetical protein
MTAISLPPDGVLDAENDVSSPRLNVKKKGTGVSGLFWGRRLCTRKIQLPGNSEKEL